MIDKYNIALKSSCIMIPFNILNSMLVTSKICLYINKKKGIKLDWKSQR